MSPAVPAPSGRCSVTHAALRASRLVAMLAAVVALMVASVGPELTRAGVSPGLWTKPPAAQPSTAPMFRALVKDGPVRAEELRPEVLLGLHKYRPVKEATVSGGQEPVPLTRRQQKANKRKMLRRRMRGDPYNPDPDEGKPAKVPGKVEQLTQREQLLLLRLRKADLPSEEEMSKAVLVFAKWAMEEVRWLPVQRELFSRRSRRWLQEMLKLGMKPSGTVLRMVLKACAAVGDIMGAQYWMNWMLRHGRPVGRAEYNAVVGAAGNAGWPVEAIAWMRRMQNANIKPDAHTYAGLILGWSKSGNRVRMLKALEQMQLAAAGGNLARPLAREHAVLPYIHVARSYAEVGDAPRAIAILKFVKDTKGLPVTHQVHRVRLEAWLNAAPDRRDKKQALAALVDVLQSRPEGEPIFSPREAKSILDALNGGLVSRTLKDEGTSWKQLVASLPSEEEEETYLRRRMKEALRENKAGVDYIIKRKVDAQLAMKLEPRRRDLKRGLIKQRRSMAHEEEQEAKEELMMA